MVADVAAPAPCAEDAGSDGTQEQTKMAPQPATQDTPLPPGSEPCDAEELKAYVETAEDRAPDAATHERGCGQSSSSSDSGSNSYSRSAADGASVSCGAYHPRLHRWRGPGDGWPHGCAQGTGHRGRRETAVW